MIGWSFWAIPETPEELTDILTKYLGDQLSKMYIIYNEGNEWKNPEAAGLEKQLKSNMEKMLRDRAETVDLDEIRTGLLVTFFNTLYNLHIEPGLKSMLTDVNQNSDLDKRLRSRTDDLNVVLRLSSGKNKISVTMKRIVIFTMTLLSIAQGAWSQDKGDAKYTIQTGDARWLRGRSHVCKTITD